MNTSSDNTSIIETAFEQSDIRVQVDEDARVWLCAADVFRALDIAWRGSKSLKNYPEKWIRLRNLRSQNAEIDTFFISEPAVYRVILTSRKAVAQRFAEWVFEDLLPSIRANGFYGQLDSIARKRVTDSIVKVGNAICKGDAFTQQLLLMPELRNLYLMLRIPVPDLALLNNDPTQYRLQLMQASR
jgi:prophage antirepressor-like protein